MDKEIDPSNIGKHENLIKQAQAEMNKTDVLVCGKCHNVYHFIELFKQHKDKGCTKDSSLKDCKETKPKVWAFLLWKASQINNSDDLGQTNVNAWKLYQTWVKMDESIRETWVVAGRTIQSFAKMGQSNLHEMPVKITRTVVDVSDKKNPNTFNRRAIDMKSKKMSDNENTDTDDDINISGLSARSSKFSDSEVPLKKPVITRLSSNTTVRMSPQQQKAPILLNKNLPVRTAIRTIPNTDETQTQDATVEKILAKRFNPRKKQHEYLIKWENFAHEKNTWELPGNLETCKHLLDNFEQQLARQKEQRARQQLLAQQAEVKQQNTIIKVTSSPNTSPSKNRPARNSKVKALDQVKQWCEEQDTVTTVAPTLKRKATDEEDSDYEATDEQDEEESYMTNKKLKTENVAVSNALTKVSQTGNVRIQQVNKVQTARTLNGGTSPDVKNSAEIVITKDTKSTGVIKKPGALISPTVKTEPQIRVVQKGETTSSGVVRITQNTAPTTTRPINQGVTRLINSGITAKAIPAAKTSTPTANRQVVRQAPGSLPVTSTKQAIQRTQQQLAQAKRSSLSPGGIAQNNVHAKTTITRIVKSAPNSKQSTPDQRGNVTIQKVDKNTASGIRRIQKKIIPQEDSFDDNEIEDEKEEEEDNTFIDDFSQEPTVQRSDSPERPLTLCPFTGAVLGRAEGEKTPPAPSPEPVIKIEKPSLPVPSLSRIVQKNPVQQQKPQPERKIKQQPPKAATPQPTPPPPPPPVQAVVEEPPQQQLQEHQEEELMQDDDGQIHQITPITNEDGSPMIVSGEDGTIYQVAGKNAEGQTILIAQGVDGEQQRVYVAACDDDLGLDGAIGQDAGEGQFMIKDEDGSDPTQALSIVTDSGDSQDITAEVVQADQPSPGGTRRVVLLLPDGNFMMTDVSAEQYQSLNLVS